MSITQDLRGLAAQGTQDVRDYAAKIGADEQAALARGMEEKAQEFRRRGVRIYERE